MATLLNKLFPPDTRILVIPARRTQQTAQSLGRSILTEPHILPGYSTQDILHAVNWPNEEGYVLVVGYQPVLGEVAGLLMTGQPQYWSVKKGAVWWLSSR